MSVRRLMVTMTVLLAMGTTCACQPAAAHRRTAAPRAVYAVGVRTITLARGADRPLPTTVWYPAAGAAGNEIRHDAPIAAGRFPLVLFSHGLHSLPAWHVQLTTRWAAAGFVVAAPAYPHTRFRAAHFDRTDVRRQPADAWHVVRAVVGLGSSPGDRFAGHLVTDHIAAAGHSAGGFTTAGLFTAGHSPNLRGGIVIAGGTRDVFAGPPAAMLFVHGSADRVVSAARGRAAYERVPWPSAFLTVLGQDHASYLNPGRPGFTQVMATTTDFLRWTLYGDIEARHRLPADAARSGVTGWRGRL